MMTPKVGMLILLHNDIEKGADFYQKLGCALKFHIKEKWAEFDLNGIKLGLAKTTQELPERLSGIVLEVDDLQAYHQELIDKGVEFISPPTEREHGVIASIKDPGNNILDFYQPTPEKLKKMVAEAAKKEKCVEGQCGCKNDA